MRTFNFLIDFSGRATNQTQRIYGREKIMMADRSRLECHYLDDENLTRRDI